MRVRLQIDCLRSLSERHGSGAIDTENIFAHIGISLTLMWRFVELRGIWLVQRGGICLQDPSLVHPFLYISRASNIHKCNI